LSFSFGAAKNPEHDCRRDQNGARAFSVPGTGFANRGIERAETQMSRDPSGVTGHKRECAGRPSATSTGGPIVEVELLDSGAAGSMT
jgi:hypothetical protein